jgi:hypothetical protein
VNVQLAGIIEHTKNEIDSSYRPNVPLFQIELALQGPHDDQEPIRSGF